MMEMSSSVSLGNGQVLQSPSQAKHKTLSMPFCPNYSYTDHIFGIWSRPATIGFRALGLGGIGFRV